MPNKICKHRKYNRIVFSVILMLGISPAAYAASSLSSLSSLTNTLTVGNGGYVQGTCNSIMGDIANVKNLNNFQSSLINTIKKVGEVLNTGQMQQLEEQQTIDNQKLQEKSLAEDQIEQFKAREKYIEQSGGINQENCPDATAINNLSSGLQAAQQSASADYAAALQAEKPVVNPLQSVDNLASVTAPVYSATTILPVGDQPATASAVSAAIATSVVPIPAMTPGTAAKKTPAGTNFKAVEHIQEARASLASEALAKIAQYNLPTINGSALVKQWWSGMSGNPPGKGSNGDYSPDAMLQIATDSKYSNPTFYNTLETKGETWNIKEYDKMMAVQLRMDYEQDQMLQRAVALQAAMLAEKLQPDITELDNLRAKAMQQAAGSMAGQTAAK